MGDLLSGFPANLPHFSPCWLLVIILPAGLHHSRKDDVRHSRKDDLRHSRKDDLRHSPLHHPSALATRRTIAAVLTHRFHRPWRPFLTRSLYR